MFLGCLCTFFPCISGSCSRTSVQDTTKRQTRHPPYTTNVPTHSIGVSSEWTGAHELSLSTTQVEEAATLSAQDLARVAYADDEDGKDYDEEKGMMLRETFR